MPDHDIERIHERLDAVLSKITAICERLARLEQQTQADRWGLRLLIQTGLVILSGVIVGVVVGIMV